MPRQKKKYQEPKTNNVVEFPSSVPLLEPLMLDFTGAARLLSSTVWTVRHLHWSKKLIFKKIGRKYLVHIDDLRAFANQFKAA